MNKSVLNFNDYKEFVRFQIGHGSSKLLAQHLGVNASMVSQILSGPKDFTLEQGEKLLSFFNLKNMDAEYFLILIQIARAGTTGLKKIYERRAIELRSNGVQIKHHIQVDRALTAEEKSKFYSSWIYSAIQIFTSIDGGKTFEQISEAFRVERVRLLEVLEFLVEKNLCQLQNKMYSPGVQSTHIEKGSPFLVQHHNNWRVKALEKAESLQDQELMFTANISLSNDDFLKLREHLMKCIKDFMDVVKPSPPQVVANLNIDFFKVN